MRSFKSSEHPCKKVDGPYFAVSAQNPHQWPCNDFATKARGKHAAILWISNRQSIQRLIYILKHNGDEAPKGLSPTIFQEWTDTRTFSDLKYTSTKLNCILIDICIKSRKLLRIKVTADLPLTDSKNGGNLGLVLKMKNITCISILLTKHIKYIYLYLLIFYTVL